jgi:predicted enzyme related to lactoylglutathione lyase
MDNPVVHFEILGPNGADVIAFYRELFGWDLRQVPMTGYHTYAYLPQPDEGIGGGVGQLDAGDPAGPSMVTVYIEVEDLHATLIRAMKAGATVSLTPTDIDGVGTIARFRDPHGNTIGLVRSRRPNQV